MKVFFKNISKFLARFQLSLCCDVMMCGLREIIIQTSIIQVDLSTVCRSKLEGLLPAQLLMIDTE